MLLVSAGMLFSIWLLLKKTRIGLIIQAALTHPDMVSALGHDVPLVFTIVFAGGCTPGRPRRGDRRQLPHHRFRHGRRDGADRVRRRGLRRSRIARRLLHRLHPHGHGADVRGRGRMARSPTCSRPSAYHSAATRLLGEILTIPVARVGPLLPYVLMILILFFRPRGLMGTRRDMSDGHAGCAARGAVSCHTCARAIVGCAPRLRSRPGSRCC